MTNVVITLKVMPNSPEVDMEALESNVKDEIEKFGGDVGKVEFEPIGYGLTALKCIFVMDEEKGSTDPLEEAVKALDNVESVEVVDVRRAIG
ncbi:elongation factor 1-beta [Candidatus Woesearchaeota archaeon]|nr:elongation factor 1-beta [Candidatus Woesearchaeota archaeon]